MKETKEASVLKMVKLSNLDLHRYYHALALTKRVEKAKFKKSRSYTREDLDQIKSLLSELMKKSNKVITYLKQTDFSDNTYELNKAKAQVSDRLETAEEKLEDSETDQSWLEE